MTSTAVDLSIDLQDVSKVYRRRVHALRGIAMRVHRGEIFGLLGPNGAGKSTLVKIMMTVIRPTTAVGTVLGKTVGDKPTLARVGYLPENHRFPRYLTGQQVLMFFAALAKVERRVARRRAGELLEVVGMSAWADAKIGTYSKGMMQRLGLAQAMVNDPDLIVLDEPTDGVDPAGRRDIRGVLQQLRARGKTVFLNSHLLSELETVCDRVAILVGGKVATQGTIDDLTRHRQFYLFEMNGAGDHWAAVGAALPGAFPGSASRPASIDGGPPPLPGAAPVRGTLPGGAWCDFDGAQLRIGVTEPEDVQGILDALRRAGVVVRRMQPVRPSLEDLFMEAITDPATGEAGRPGARNADDDRTLAKGTVGR